MIVVYMILYKYRWYESHDRLQKLNQQATLEATEHREEYIKDQIISYGKVYITLLSSPKLN